MMSRLKQKIVIFVIIALALVILGISKDRLIKSSVASAILYQISQKLK